MPWKEMKGEAEAQAGYQFAYWALPGAGRAGGLAERTGGKVPASRNRASRSASVAMDFSPWLQRPEHRAVFTLLEGVGVGLCVRVCARARARACPHPLGQEVTAKAAWSLASRDRRRLLLAPPPRSLSPASFNAASWG